MHIAESVQIRVYDLNINPRFALYMFDRFALRLINKADNSSRSTGASGSATSMHICFAVFWGIEMKNTFDTVNVDTSSSYIGSNKN